MTEHLAKTPVRSDVQAVIFDWGGTITPWHTIDLRAQWEAFASGMGAIACARNGLAAALYTAEEQAWRRGRTDGSSARLEDCLLYTSPSPRDRTRSRMPSSA